MSIGPGAMALRKAVRMLLLTTVGFAGHARASDAITAEPGGASHYYFSHYSVDIASGGHPGEEGDFRRFYPGQDFMVQIIKVIPNRLRVIANLPSTFNDEYATGAPC